MAERFPEFPQTGSIWITEVTDNEIDSSAVAFYRIAKVIIEQADALTTQVKW
jgi:hypothetical protein